MRYLWIVIAAAGILAALMFAYRHRPENAVRRLSPGDHPPAPEFSLSTIDGQTLDLASYRSKVVLLDFWATWCTPCREETPRFVQLQDKYRDQGLQIIGISMDDTVEPVLQFYRQFHMNYPVALGDAKLGELYGGVLGLPIAFLIGRDGHIYFKHIGATDFSLFEREIAQLLSAKPAGLAQ